MYDSERSMVRQMSADVNSHSLHAEQIWELLKEVSDPEIPVLSLVDLKIVRDVVLYEGNVTVNISPTFLGCPAIEQMKKDIIARLTAAGIESICVEVVFTPAWSTDLLDDAVKEKLRQFGIAPPPRKSANPSDTLRLPVACPHCGSEETRLENSFGPTLCRQMYYCTTCQQMFERFKPL